MPTPIPPAELTIRPLTRAEFDLTIDRAAAEGWNPGLHDAELFWQTDPDAFLGAEYQGRLVASGSIVSYGDAYGFMGLFIVESTLRGRGIGTALWFHRRDLLRSRLRPGAAIGMDGVFEMQAWYARGGFKFSHRNLRMTGTATTGPKHAQIFDLTELPPSLVADYDRDCFGCAREKFLTAWITQPDASALGHVEDDRLLGYGVIRKCRVGHKIGPLFADDSDTADSLLTALANYAAGSAIFLDIPENNPAARSLATRHGLTEVFGCARMYNGPAPATDDQKIFGITTFELG